MNSLLVSELWVPGEDIPQVFLHLSQRPQQSLQGIRIDALKALPVALIWFKLCHEMLTRDYAPQPAA